MLQAAAAAALTFSAAAPAVLANEFDIISEPTPTSNYVIDDASVLNRSTRKGLNDDLARLEVRAGAQREDAHPQS